MIARQIERLEAGHKLEHVVEASGAIERSSTPVRHRRDAAGHIGRRRRDHAPTTQPHLPLAARASASEFFDCIDHKRTCCLVPKSFQKLASAWSLSGLS